MVTTHVLYLAARGRHWFCVSVRDVEQDTGRLQSGVNGTGTEWLVTDEESSPLELDDVTFLDAMETRIPHHLVLHLDTIGIFTISFFLLCGSKTLLRHRVLTFISELSVQLLYNLILCMV